MFSHYGSVHEPIDHVSRYLKNKENNKKIHDDFRHKLNKEQKKKSKRMTQSMKKADEMKRYTKDTFDQKWQKAILVRNNKLAMDNMKEEMGFERYNKDLDEIS